VNRCFVIQPLDGGKFDKRFDDIFAPAITAANLEPYRIDRDPNVTIPIEDIQSGIESSRACLADITNDNPNVWFELGYAIASQREVVLICSDERTSRFPFDVQHRNIIKYSTESSCDFDQLEEKITTRLKAMLEKEGRLGALARMSSVAPAVEGLEQYEIASLVAVAQQLTEPNGGISAYLIQQDMEKAGFTHIATMLGVRGLTTKQMLEPFEAEDYGDACLAYRVTELGMAWLHQNTDRLKLKADPPKLSSSYDVPF